MKKYAYLIILFTLIFCSAKATHNRAGEITYKQVSAYTFEFTVTTFTYSLSAVEINGGRTQLEVEWGDNTTSEAPLFGKPLPLPDFYIKRTFRSNHTFPGPGTYKIVMQDPNRNLGVLNIPNSVNVIFSVETTLLISPQLGTNNTPVLLNDPIDKAAVGKIFIHNPAAFDYDGDSLSYKLTVCTKDNGVPITNYTFPKSSDTAIYVNPITGDLVWDAPVDTGIYNIAMLIEEWRKGVKIGNIERDMQVEVHNTNNHPPVNPPINKICVEAGTLIDFNITSTDQDNDMVMQYATGGPFVVTNDKAIFTVIQAIPGSSTANFKWQTDCSHVRKQPYTVVLKSEDNNASLKLVDISNFDILVVGPAPKNLTALPRNNAILINWDKSICPNAVGYDIYRSPSSVTLKDTCPGGMPTGTGYVKIATVKGINDTAYLDNNDGQGLSRGIDYCYRVIAIFPDGANSHPSNEACATIVPGIPALTSASVIKIDSINGQIFVSWIRPYKKLLDSIQAPGPYVYFIYRTDNFEGSNFALIDTIPSTDLADTTFTDINLNTKRFPYNYKVELYNNTPGNRFLIGNAETASSMYPNLFPADNQITVKFAQSVPWLNNQYIIYKQNSQTLAFDSIGQTETDQYIDKGLANGHPYTYRVKAYGYRQLNNTTYNTLNWSHINSSAALDTVKPCAPDLQLKSICDSSIIILTWPNVNKSCANDIVKYNVYFKNKPTDNFPSTPIATIMNIPGVDSFEFRNTPPLTPKKNPSGCYAVTAVDSFANESLKNEDCITNCSPYSLPNVFTPNNDNVNDVYKANNPDEYVQKVDMKIFNRWGKLVYHTTDPDINWDGRDQETKQLVSTGVYFYICDVYEPIITGIYLHNLHDFIYVYYNKSGGTPAQP